MSLANGVYVITSSVSGYPAMDLEGGNAPIANIIAFKEHGGKNQQWKLTKMSRDEFTIQSVYGGTYITYPNDSSAQLTSSFYEPGYNKEGRWRIVKESDGYAIYSIFNSAKAVDLSGGKTANLTPLIIYDHHGGSNQIWKFKKVA